MAEPRLTRRGLPVHVPPKLENLTVRTRAEAKALGDTRYFTGKLCPSGHIAERRVSNWKCVQCARDEFSEMMRNDPERSRKRAGEYQKRNPEKAHARKVRWVEQNCEHVFEQRRKFRAENQTRIKEGHRAYYLANREKVLEQTARWQRANTDKVRVRNARWADANPEARRAVARRRRARLLDAEGTHNGPDILMLFEQQGGICAACAVGIADGYHVDHIMPLSRGGSNWPSNLQLLCAPCNSSKGALTMDEWVAKLEARESKHGLDSRLPDNISGRRPA